VKKKCFIGRRLVSLKRESTINLFTDEKEEVLRCDQEKITLRGKNFELKGEELNYCSGTEK
jgi:hypothetical protein